MIRSLMIRSLMMRSLMIRSLVIPSFIGFLALCFAAQAQEQPPASDPGASDPGAIKVSTRVVLVDSVVTDKRGSYVRDLQINDFKIWEDGKEQAVTSFSLEDDSTDPARAARHYLVLFFDDTTMEFGDQAKARDAAAKFVAANAGPNRLIAVVEFGGVLRVAQNFTADADRLKKAVAGIRFSTLSPNGPSPEFASMSTQQMSQPDSLGPRTLGDLEADFGARSVFIALRDMANGLAGVAGRKSLVMLSAGFPMNMEQQAELTSVIDACNKANVAVYPIDVRGLVVPVIPTGDARPPSIRPDSAKVLPAALNYTGSSDTPLLEFAPFVVEDADWFQHSGGGGSGGGHGGGGGVGSGGGHGGGTFGGGGTTTGGHSGTGVPGTPVTPYSSTNLPPRQLVPQVPDVNANQQFLYELAEGTGGFVIVNTNDLLGGLERIAKDQGQYYLLGYKPPDSSEGSCHTLKVKIDRGGTNVRSRSGYCRVRPRDLLAGSATEKELESHASGELAGNVVASARVPYFYTSPGVARVHLAMEIPSASLQFEKVKGKQHAVVNVLGIAYKPDGTVAARFSDSANLDFESKKEQEEFQKAPYRYEKQFDIAAGTYSLRVAFSSGNATFGKLDSPLTVLPFDGKKISLSAVALSNAMVKTADLKDSLDAQFLEDGKPLVVHGEQIFPSATNHFKKTDDAVAYTEIYEPLLEGAKPPEMAVEFRIVEQKKGEKKLDVGVIVNSDLIRRGNPVVPIGLKLPLATLPAGSYRVELKAEDNVGHSTDFQVAEFELE